MILESRETYRPMKENKELKNKLAHINSNSFQKKANTIRKGKTDFSTHDAGKIEYPHA